MLALLCSVVGPLMADEHDKDEADAPHTLLPEVDDLMALGETARDAGVPILLMFASEDCPFCERLEAEVLGPMRLVGDDPRRVLLRKVMLESPTVLHDFRGRETTVGELAGLKKVYVVPTLFLLDAEGRELVPKMVGYTSPDFYPAYLDQAIDVARELLRQGEAP